MAARDLSVPGREERHGDAARDLNYSRPTRGGFFMGEKRSPRGLSLSAEQSVMRLTPHDPPQQRGIGRSSRRVPSCHSPTQDFWLREAVLAPLDAAYARSQACASKRVCGTLGPMADDQRPNSNAPKRDRTPAVSRVFSDGSLIELLYRASDAQTAFAVWRDGGWTFETDVEIGGERLVPFSPRNNIIKNDVVLLPSEPQEYGSKAELLD